MILNWKTSIITAALVVLTLLSVAGCNAAGTVTHTAAATTTQAVQPPAGSGQRPSFSDNGAMPDFSSDNMMRPGGPGGQSGMPRIDWAAAAENLEVTADDLKAAFGDMTQGMPDFAAIAVKLGVTEDKLKDALGLPDDITLPGDGRNQPPQGDLPSASPKATPDTSTK
jgi:hypothetical protein